MPATPQPNQRYGIVIDAGSSGSRLYVYEWDDPNDFKDGGADASVRMKSVPQIRQDPSWSRKISPGLSSFEKKPKKAYKKHIKSLLEFATKIIPADKIKDTPVFIQGTAGLRLLPKEKRTEILHEVCNGIKKHTNFLMEDCDYQVQVIDGETEGLYGWLSLNYLLGKFDNYDTTDNSHFTFGFMDMGGASAQIAFVPSDKQEIERHKDDIATIYLKNLNGELQEWDVFVSTWLGFGANQARRRYLAQLINALPENTNSYDDDDFKTRKLSDPCTPKGAKLKFEFKDKDFTIIGSGNYEQCNKSIYPLLLKNLPCEDEPCLFNGIHAPRIDYKKDRFVGTSEYWYTANDVFKLGGEYNFLEFNEQVINFCSSDWQAIKHQSDNGAFNNMPEDFLKDTCFKANWVLNVLHEGFELPMLGFEKELPESRTEEYPLFQSLEKINDRDLSWTLGRILLYASSTIMVGNSKQPVGVQPSTIEASRLGKSFSPGGLLGSSHLYLGTNSHFWRSIILFILLIASIYAYVYRHKIHRLTCYSKTVAMYLHTKNQLYSLATRGSLSKDPISRLEEGFGFGLDRNKNIREEYKMDLTSSFTESSSRRLDRDGILGNGILSKNNSSSHLSTPKAGVTPRPAFSIADFAKFKDERFTK
ncbi:apyrase [Nakaseomyces bracarensis]|uniref:apyrase n=1 Tax=Nakaseomyces bracarensis TaxID=273131 RepID=UPI00387137C9